MRPRREKLFQVAVRPHADVKRAISLVVLFDKRNSIRRKPACRRDNESIYAGRLPKFHLGAHIADIPDSDASGLPMLALNNDA
jgi:hypothetical protein